MAKMACPVCHSPSTRTYDTRAARFNELRRRRKCPNGHRFTTFESIDHSDDEE